MDIRDQSASPNHSHLWFPGAAGVVHCGEDPSRRLVSTDNKTRNRNGYRTLADNPRATSGWATQQREKAVAGHAAGPAMMPKTTTRATPSVGIHSKVGLFYTFWLQQGLLPKLLSGLTNSDGSASDGIFIVDIDVDIYIYKHTGVGLLLLAVVYLNRNIHDSPR